MKKSGSVFLVLWLFFCSCMSPAVSDPESRPSQYSEAEKSTEEDMPEISETESVTESKVPTAPSGEIQPGSEDSAVDIYDSEGTRLFTVYGSRYLRPVEEGCFALSYSKDGLLSAQLYDPNGQLIASSSSVPDNVGQDLVQLDNQFYMLTYSKSVDKGLARCLVQFTLPDDSDTIQTELIDIELEEPIGGRDYLRMIDNQLYLLISDSEKSLFMVYDSEMKTFSTVAETFSDDPTLKEQWIAVSADEATISFLVLILNDSNEAELRLDVFDHSMNFLKSYDVSNIFPESERKSVSGGAFPQNPLSVAVTAFEFSGDILFFQNANGISFFGKVSDAELEPWPAESTSETDVFQLITEYREGETEHLILQNLSTGDQNLLSWNLSSGTVRTLPLSSQKNPVDTEFKMIHGIYSGDILLQHSAKKNAYGILDQCWFFSSITKLFENASVQ